VTGGDERLLRLFVALVDDPLVFLSLSLAFYRSVETPAQVGALLDPKHPRAVAPAHDGRPTADPPRAMVTLTWLSDCARCWGCSISVRSSDVAVAYHEAADIPLYTWELSSLSALEGEMWCRILVPAGRWQPTMSFYVANVFRLVVSQEALDTRLGRAPPPQPAPARHRARSGYEEASRLLADIARFMPQSGAIQLQAAFAPIVAALRSPTD
jgi:hypothetical protein